MRQRLVDFVIQTVRIPAVHPDPNSQTPDPSTRPTRIPLIGQILILLLLAASFVSGVLMWWGKQVQADEMVTPVWLHGTVVVHGALNPFLCILFGYLLCHHVRVGWQLRANLISGLFMEVAFMGMILSGIGLYYAASPDWREKLVLTHRILGLLLPLGLAGHWVSGLLWARQHRRPSP
jgi:hypothetical protein